MSNINRRLDALERVMNPRSQMLVAFGRAEADRLLDKYDARGEPRPDVVIFNMPKSGLM